MNPAKIIQDTDFFGTGDQYQLAEDCYNSIQPYINKYEEYYLQELLGSVLYDLLYADITTPFAGPDTARFQDIFDPFAFDESNQVIRSEGMKEMLKQFIYFHVVRDLSVNKTVTGVVFNSNENSEGPLYKGFNIIEAYNEGVRNARAIQWFVLDNPTVYPEENTQLIRYASGI